MRETSKLSKHNVTLHTEPATIQGDHTRIEQILANLIDNAAKYTHEGGDIRISLTKEGPVAILRVEDSGAGIDQTLLPYIFDVFVQGDNTLARTKGGLGIGLSLVHRLVSKHGGTVTAASDGIAKGSAFEVRLPVLEMPATSITDASTGTSSSLDGVRILLVEDQDDLREMTQTLLREAGLLVSSAANGREALEIATDSLPDVGILDIGLPDIDGYELARLLKNTGGLSEMSLIALTGYGLAADKERALLAGFDAHLIKPLQIDELLRCLRDLVSNRKDS